MTGSYFLLSLTLFASHRHYDAKRQAALARAKVEEARDKGMGERRKRMKDELERREREHAGTHFSMTTYDGCLYITRTCACIHMHIYIHS